MIFSIDKLRQENKNLPKIILERINIKAKSKVAEFFFINDAIIDEDDLTLVKDSLKQYLPKDYLIKLSYEKRVCDEETLKNTVKSYILNNHPSVKPFLKDGDIEAAAAEGGFYYAVSAGQSLYLYFSENGLIEKLDSYLDTVFCEQIKGSLILNGKSIDSKKILEAAARREQSEEFLPLNLQRVFEIKDKVAIEGEVTSALAVYMADCEYETDNLTVCGFIKKIEQRLTKNQKPYFLFELDDGTYDDKIRTFKAKMFPYKRALEKIEKLKEGDCVALSGKMESYNNFLSMLIESVAYGALPENFVPEKLESRAAPLEYINIKPTTYAEASQANLFEKKKILPSDLVNNTFVVFDLETTGLINNAIGLDKIDEIIEIGAVKIEGGVITEMFSSLIKPNRPISQEITKITGIDDGMVRFAPPIEAVIPDFFKFTRGAILVGHNVDFDYKFIRHYSKEMGYIYDNRAYDTISLAQFGLHLTNYKLSTVAAHYGFEFNHHRAADDAVVTAKIFIELVTTQKHLPK